MQPAEISDNAEKRNSYLSPLLAACTATILLSKAYSVLDETKLRT